MNKTFLFALVLALVAIAVPAHAGMFTFEKISNELSLYQNYTDDVDTHGQTIQVVAINRFRAIWWFQAEFTADFNYDYDKSDDWDYYLEIGLLKPLVGGLSINYQRVEGTFVSEPTNQIGLRWTF